MAKILIPTPLRQYAGKQDSVQLAGATVGEVLQSLTSQYADLRRHLYNDEGKLRSFVNVYVNDEDIRYLNKEATPLKDGDTVSIVPEHRGRIGRSAPRRRVTLSKDEILRYSRHLIMPEVGMEGQLKLKSAKVALIGTGGLGAPLGHVSGGGGRRTHRPGGFRRGGFHQPAAPGDSRHQGRRAARSWIRRRTRCSTSIRIVEIDRHETALTSENALEILKDYDIVVDGTDNFPTRYLVNDACVLLGKPNVYGSIFRFEGQATVFAYEGGPCYRCLYPEPPPPGLVPSCAEGGVLGILPGTIGLIQATETVKLILGIGEPLVGRLLLYDALAMRFRELKLRRNPECPVCGDHPTIHELIDYQQFCGIPNQPHEPVAVGRRYRSGGSEGEDRSRRSVRADRCARAARISDLQYPVREADPAGRSAEARERAEFGRRDRRALQERHAQREGGGFPEAGRIPQGPQHEGRNSGLER